MVIKKNNGFSFVEILMSLGMLGAIASGSLVFYQNSQKSTAKLDLQNTILLIRENLVATVQNDSAWKNTISQNTSMQCLGNANPCVPDIYDPANPGKYGRPFVLYNAALDAGGTVGGNVDQLVYDPSSLSNGFTIHGDLCNSYSDVTPNDACPIRANLRWAAICQGTGCLNPQVAVLISFKFSSSKVKSSLSESRFDMRTERHFANTENKTLYCSNSGARDKIYFPGMTEIMPFNGCEVSNNQITQQFADANGCLEVKGFIGFGPQGAKGDIGFQGPPGGVTYFATHQALASGRRLKTSTHTVTMYGAAVRTKPIPGDHDVCILTSVYFDGDKVATCLLAQDPNNIKKWSMVMQDEGSKKPVSCSVLCGTLAGCDKNNPSVLRGNAQACIGNGFRGIRVDKGGAPGPKCRFGSYANINPTAGSAKSLYEASKGAYRFWLWRTRDNRGSN